MVGVGRNDLCPCGSKKKYKKCCINKHPRTHGIYIGHKEQFQGISLKNGQVSEVHLLSGERVKPDLVFSRTHYTTKKGKDKVLTRIPNEAALDIPSLLASRFDVLFVIDTNTKVINDNVVSVACVLECHARKITTTEVEITGTQGNIIFRNCPKEESERHAWYQLVKGITSSPKYNHSLRIAIISDHDLDRHSKYNARELPIYKDFYLPNNFTLIYASSDSGKENVLNRLIIECDQDARNVLRQFEEGGLKVGNSTITIDRSLGFAAQVTCLTGG